RAPPRPTTFPYPTLFRSQPVGPAEQQLILEVEAVAGRSDERREEQPMARLLGVKANRGIQHRVMQVATFDSPGVGGRQQQGRTRDRKSTRLNSSHRTISY